jgi:hypothetical protein
MFGLRRSTIAFVLVSAICLGTRPAVAAPLTVDYFDPVTGWEWADLTQTTNLTWNQVNTACSQDGMTPCINFGAMEFAGWIWATADQVRDLVVNATDLTAADLADYSENQVGSTWAPQFLNAFNSTGSAGAGRPLVQGWSSTSIGNLFAYDPIVLDDQTGGGDGVNIHSTLLKTSAFPEVGVWLHRPAAAAAVPEPATLLMLGGGLAALAAARRRRQS